MNDLSVFNFQGKPVRVVKDEKGEPWFVAKDIADALGYTSTEAMTRRLDEDEKGATICSTLGGEQKMNIINESGVYSSILGSSKPNAKTFKRWVTHEVLPAIRKDGGYMISKPNETPEELMARALLVANATMERQKKRLEELENTVTEMTPHAEYSKKVLASENLHTVNSIGVHLGISAQKLNKFLVAQGWIYKQGLVYCPAAKIRDLGYCDYHIVPYNACGEIHTREHLKWTEKGRKAVIELWNSTNGVLPMVV